MYCTSYFMHTAEDALFMGVSLHLLLLNTKEYKVSVITVQIQMKTAKIHILHFVICLAPANLRILHKITSC
jgi:hypothetical protein